MDQPTYKPTRVILIGGSSHAGKSTLARSLATVLGWDYLSTDTLARHPGRPWVGENGRAIPEHVVEHYKTLTVEALFADVLVHYEKNVLPQVKAIVRARASDSSAASLVLEGSALWPGFVINLLSDDRVKAIWLTVSESRFGSRILCGSDFQHLGTDERYIVQKFLDRTLFYDERMRNEIERLGLTRVDIESVSTPDELAKKCMELMAIPYIVGAETVAHERRE